MSAPVFILIALFGLFGLACCIVAIALLVVELWEGHEREQLAREAQAFLRERERIA